MKKLIAIAALGATALFVSIAPLAFAGEQEGPVFEPRPARQYQTEPAQGTGTFSSGEDVWEPLNPDVRG